MKKIFGSAFVALIVLSSCKKDKDSCDITVATISGTYKVVAAVYTVPGIPGSMDYYDQMDACQQDDLQILNANGTYTYDDAGAVCNPNGDDSGTWSLSGNTITVNGEAGTIQSFNCDRLIINIENIFTTGDKLSTTLEKQ